MTIADFPRTMSAFLACIVVIPLYYKIDFLVFLIPYTIIVCVIAFFVDINKYDASNGIFVSEKDENTKISEFLSQYLEQQSVKPLCITQMMPVWIMGRGKTGKHMVITFYDNIYKVDYGQEELAEIVRVSDIYLWANMLGVNLEKFKKETK